MSAMDDAAALLAAIVASSDDAIVSKDLDGYVTSWNGAAERMFGYTAAEMIGAHISTIIPLDRRSEEDLVLSRVREGLGVEHFETVRRRKDGSLVHVSLSVSPVRARDGRILGASKIARDIGERTLMEREAGRLAAIVASSDDAIMGKTLDGVIQTWNGGAERMFGYTAAEAIGRSIALIIPEERIAEEESVISRIRAGDGVKHYETVRRTRDGRLIDVDVSVSPIRSKTGSVVGASKIVRDITEQKRLWLAVEEANRAKDAFLGTLSHELRTPLNTVLGYTQMLKNGAIAADALPRALDVIARNVEALTQRVNDVLDISKIISGDISLSRQLCDVAPIAEAAAASIEWAARAKSIRVTTRIAPTLMVNGDPNRLRQVFWNLMSNAVKFSDEGGALTLAATAEPGAVRVSVANSGVGIAPQALPHVFRPFWQADNTHTRMHGGLGLGLALVQSFVELHGGHVEAHSEGPGHGARFDVVLPAADVTTVR
jgi:PAS domain S-box-containing protein